MAFGDEEEALAPQGRRGSYDGRRRDHHRQVLVRRAVGAGVVVLLLILIVLGIRGCLDARKERGFENYVSDLNAIAAQSKQLSEDFFNRLSDPGNLSPLSLEAEIKSYRGSAEGLADRVDSLDTPDELQGAQSELELAFDLRRDALTGISDNISTALGTQGRSQAVNAIADYMRYFLASDVLYQRARTEIDAVLEDQGIDERAPESIFLTDPERWLDSLEVTSALAQVSGGKQASGGTHGLALYQTIIKPGDVSLDPTSRRDGQRRRASSDRRRGPEPGRFGRGGRRRQLRAHRRQPDDLRRHDHSRGSPPAASRRRRSRSTPPRTPASS